jgi:hypothetical protein
VLTPFCALLLLLPCCCCCCAAVLVQWNEVQTTSELDSLIAAIDSEYSARIRLEEQRKSQFIRALKEHEKRAEETFLAYRQAMDTELEQTVSYLKRVRDKHEHVSAWTRTEQGTDGTHALALMRMQQRFPLSVAAPLSPPGACGWRFRVTDSHAAVLYCAVLCCRSV